MVKNKKGGKGSKKIARKHVMDVSQRIIRYVKEEGEMYAVVAKHFGGQCEVVTTDGETRLCIVRGKFKGRRRRDNNISLGTWVMVGIRDWEIRGDGKTKCDLLYVYSDLDKEELKQNTNINFKEMDKVNTEISGVEIDENVVFKENNGVQYLDDNDIIMEEDEDEVGDEGGDEDGVGDGDHKELVNDKNEIIDKDNTICEKKEKYVFDIDEI